MIEIAASIIAIISLSISLYFLIFDKVRLKIISVSPGISGTRSSNDNIWKHSISSIGVKVQNKGKRNARNCEGLVTFKELDALPLFSTEKGEVLTESNKFDILAGEKKNLVVAWKFSGIGINGNSGLDKGTFLEKAPPITVIIHFGEKRITKTISSDQIEKLLRKHEEEAYKHS